MRAIVIGLGSMGKRRIRLIQQLGAMDSICGIDGREDRRTEAAEMLGIETCASIEEALSKGQVDCAFVCTSPLSHAAIIRQCLERDLHVFTEINLVPDLYRENMALAREKNRVLFLSSTFLYREEIRYIRTKVADYGRSLNYTYHIGQYLPDWHPWEDYTKFFVGETRTNGCREILAIEMPWITETFGPIKSVTAIHDRNSDLKINYDDNYVIQILHENGCKGSLNVDIVCPKAVRNLEIYGEHFYLNWNGTPTGLQEFQDGEMQAVSLYDSYEHRQGYQATIIENAYMAEIRAFLAAVTDQTRPIYGFAEDEKVLHWIDRIEA